MERVAPSEQCGCDTRGDRTFLCAYHQGREDERERCAKICDDERLRIVDRVKAGGSYAAIDAAQQGVLIVVMKRIRDDDVE